MLVCFSLGLSRWHLPVVLPIITWNDFQLIPSELQDEFDTFAHWLFWPTGVNRWWKEATGSHKRHKVGSREPLCQIVNREDERADTEGSKELMEGAPKRKVDLLSDFDPPSHFPWTLLIRPTPPPPNPTVCSLPLNRQCCFVSAL